MTSHGVPHQRSIACVKVWESCFQIGRELLSDVLIHAPLLPLRFRRVQIKARANSEIPTVRLSWYLMATWRSVWEDHSNILLVRILLDAALLRRVLVGTCQTRKVIDHRNGFLLSLICLGKIDLFCVFCLFFNRVQRERR